jgi:hypothetical protein
MPQPLCFVCFKNIGLIFSRVEAGVKTATSRPEPEPHTNDAAPQH